MLFSNLEAVDDQKPRPPLVTSTENFTNFGHARGRRDIGYKHTQRQTGRHDIRNTSSSPYRMAEVNNVINQARPSTSTRLHSAFGTMLSWQRNPCTDCKSAQQCITRGHPLPFPKLHPGLCTSVGMRRGTDTHTDRHTYGRDHYTFRLGYASRKM